MHSLPPDRTLTFLAGRSGGFSFDLQFWWYLEWPPEVQKYTLKYNRTKENGEIISINVLEFAGMIINYAAAYHFYKEAPDTTDPYPLVRLFGDNSTAESWMHKSCTKSMPGRALGRLLCALMIGNPVGIDVEHVTSEDNDLADAISRFKSNGDTLRGLPALLQEYPQLRGCRRFQPSSQLLSLLMEAISQRKLIDPMDVNSKVLTDPGRTIT